MIMTAKQNWFSTLNEALKSENLLDSWDISFSPISYGQTFQYTFQDGSKYGHLVSITRSSDGRYERPVHYKR
jgi:hypothetical protein